MRNSIFILLAVCQFTIHAQNLDAYQNLAIRLMIANEYGLHSTTDSPIDVDYFHTIPELKLLDSKNFRSSIEFYSIPFQPYLRLIDGSLLHPPLVTYDTPPMIVAVDRNSKVIYKVSGFQSLDWEQIITYGTNYDSRKKKNKLDIYIEEIQISILSCFNKKQKLCSCSKMLKS